VQSSKPRLRLGGASATLANQNAFFVFTIEDGRVTAFREFIDTASVVDVYRG
jgi:ketosteroid isomerase-like protein